MATSLQTHFPTGMYDMLEEAETKGHAHIVSWCNKGRSFKIHKPNEMIQILNKYFSQTKYKSFLRQLQTYGFTRVTRGEFKGIVSHPLLIQGKRFLCLRMKRKVPKQIRNRMSQSLYSTSRLPFPSQQSEMDLQLMSSIFSVGTQGLGRRASTGSMPMVRVEDQEMQNGYWPLLGIVRNFGENYNSSTLSLEQSNLLPIPNPFTSSDLKTYRMPLLPTANSVIAQEPVSTPTIPNILDDIDDSLCDHFTKTTGAMSDNDILPYPPMLPLGVEDEDDDWLKGIIYEGADIVLEPEKFAMTLPPDDNFNSDADTSVVSMEGIIL